MLKAGGEAKRKTLIRQMEDLALTDEKTRMTYEEEYKGKHGDDGQAENLLKQKRGHR